MVWNAERAAVLKRFLARAAYPSAFALVVLAHLVLTFHYERPGLIFGPEPNSWLDFDTHIEQVWRVTEALDGWGKAWAYDVQMLAGYPNGTIFDADNKGWELWTFALWKLGLPRGTAFNLFILLAHLMVPWVAYASARLFRLDRWASLLAMVLAMSLWFFDGFPRWNWWIGMIAWAQVGVLAVLPVALFYRYVEDGRWWRAVAAALLMAWGHLVHPYIFVALLFPMAAMYVRAFRKMGWRRHAGIVAIALFTIAVNAYWLITALRFWHYILDSGYCFQAGISYLLTDYLGLIGKDPLVSGVLSNRTGFRFLCIACTVLCLIGWRRNRDDRFLPFAAGAGALFAITYLGGYVWITRQIQPYRFILPAIFMLVIPAAHFIAETVRSDRLRGLPRKVYLVIGVLVFISLPHLARDVLYFTPALLPDLEPLPEGKSAPISDVGFGTFGFPKHMDFRHGPHWPDFTEISEWLDEHDDGQGRVLVEWNVLGEHLAWRTRSQILGGFHERNMKHAASNLFRVNTMGDMTDQELSRYLRDYAVKWVILTHRRPLLERRKGILEPVHFIQPSHRIYESQLGWSYLQQNQGHVEPSMNRIEVTGTEPSQDVVLRFHWLETLVCAPECSIVREPILGNPVGFIRVPAPHPADFVIENGY